MKYYWGINSLREDLRKLENMLREESDGNKRIELTNYIASLKNIIVSEKLKPVVDMVTDNSLFNNLGRNVISFSEFELYYPFIKTFSEKMENYFELRREIEFPETNIKYNEDELLGLVHDFYKSMPSEIYKIFLRSYNDRQRNVLFDNSFEKEPANIYLVTGLNKAYMQFGSVEENLYSNQLVNMVHEYGHYIAFILNPNRYLGENSIFVEIESIFFQLIALDMLDKKLSDVSFLELSESILGTYIWNAECIKYFKIISKAFLKGDFNNIDELRSDLEERNLIDCDILDEIIDFEYDIGYDYLYTFSYIVAISLYEIYQKDPDLAFHLLKKIICNEKGLEEYQNITETVDPISGITSYKRRILTKINNLK